MKLHHKHFLKLLIAGWIAVALAWCIDMAPALALFLVYYTLLAVQNSIGATRTLIRTLVLWCSLGIAVGCISAELMDRSIGNIQSDIFIWATLSFLVLYGSYVVPRGPEARLGFISALLVGIGGAVGSTPWYEAMTRGLTLMAALALALIVSILVFPTQASSLLENHVFQLNEHLRQLFTQINHYILKLDPNLPTKWPEKKLLHRVFRLRQQLMEAHKNVRFAKRENRQINDEFLQRNLYQLGRVLNYLVAFIRLAPKSVNNPLVKEYSSELFGIILHIQQSLRIWQHALKGEYTPVTLNPLDALTQKIDRKLRKLDLNMIQTNDLVNFVSLYHNLLSMAEDLKEFVSEAHMNVPAANKLELPYL